MVQRDGDRRVHLRRRLHLLHQHLPGLPRLPGRQPGGLQCRGEHQCLPETEIPGHSLGALAVLHGHRSQVIPTEQPSLPRGGLTAYRTNNNNNQPNKLYPDQSPVQSGNNEDEKSVCGLNTFIVFNKPEQNIF